MITTLTVQEKLNEIASVLMGDSLESSYREAELIMQHVLSLTRQGLYTADTSLTNEHLQDIDKIVSGRRQGRPLQYLLGETEFFGMTLKVGEGVFIPRPETEYMVEHAINHLIERGFGNGSIFRALDLCTGSGCIALSIGRYFPNAQVIGSDISLKALYYAKENAVLNGVSNVSFIAGDLFDCIRAKPFDLIISNPPYIMSSEIDLLQIEIRDHEPRNALNGGKDGLDFYKRILDEVGSFIHKGGSLILELGYGQSEEVSKMAKKVGLNNCRTIKDYAGIDRILVARN